MLMKVFEPKTLTLKMTHNVVEHDIYVDYIANGVSTFRYDGTTQDISRGDIIMIENDAYLREAPTSTLETYADMEYENVAREVVYLGVVSDYDAVDTISALYIYNIFSTEVDGEEFTGPELIRIIGSLNKDELLLPPIVLETDSAGDGFLKVPEDKSNGKFLTMNLVDLIIEAHRQTGAVLDFEIKQTVHPSSAKKRTSYALHISRRDRPKHPRRVRDNTDLMLNLELDFSAGATNDANKIEIVSKDFHNVERVYYSTVFGEIVDNFEHHKDEIATPVKNVIYEHDENKTYMEEAQSVIGGYRAETNIQFDVDMTKYDILHRFGKQDQYDSYQIGQTFSFQIGGKAYFTTLTGYRYSNNSNLVTFMFGYQRDTLQSVLKEMFQ